MDTNSPKKKNKKIYKTLILKEKKAEKTKFCLRIQSQSNVNNDDYYIKLWLIKS